VVAVVAGQAMVIDRVSEIATVTVEGAAVALAAEEEEAVIGTVIGEDIHLAEIRTKMAAEEGAADPPTKAGIEAVRGLGLKTAGAKSMMVNVSGVERRATSE